jgi:hypothetical protein
MCETTSSGSKSKRDLGGEAAAREGFERGEVEVGSFVEAVTAEEGQLDSRERVKPRRRTSRLSRSVPDLFSFFPSRSISRGGSGRF